MLQILLVSEPFPSNEGRYGAVAGALSIPISAAVSEPFPSNEGRYPATITALVLTIALSLVSEPFPSNEGRYPQFKTLQHRNYERVSEPFPSNEGRYPYLLKPLCCLMSRGRLRGLLI